MPYDASTCPSSQADVVIGGQFGYSSCTDEVDQFHFEEQKKQK